MAATALDQENLENVLRVEFYFSDINVSRDKFLTNSIKGNEDGLVSLALICSFTRMRNLLGLGWVGLSLARYLKKLWRLLLKSLGTIFFAQSFRRWRVSRHRRYDCFWEEVWHKY
ncbi:la protein 2-like isoform X2 [Aristolochia californica]|uniref:la protein 2-like isoform X2 n=1 Tax=Aristolochia californica TaxID=171875 RepID=UPI0035E2CCA1